jgi:hypothetical protein
MAKESEKRVSTSVKRLDFSKLPPISKFEDIDMIGLELIGEGSRLKTYDSSEEAEETK